ncbi:MAG: hypothetical protein JSV88_18120 [Candidatus Aminicenantes bacterium]|nr:MAG: hypothetical protein JSV88_18120 [Candidatus Aminicenantes bacterium]
MSDISSRDFLKNKKGIRIKLAKKAPPKKRDINKSNKLIKIILFVLILFFGFQFISHVFFSLGKNKAGEVKNSRMLELSSWLFPLDPMPFCEYGYALLESHQQTPGPGVLAQSIRYLKNSLNFNQLYYHTHFYLGKAYLYRNLSDQTSFHQAIESFKRAAMIRGNNARVSMDTITILLHMWPFLEEEDKNFCSNLLEKSLKRIQKEDFQLILDTWGLYCRDVGFFKETLGKNPVFYLQASKKLLEMEIEMEVRQEFLARYADHILNDIKRDYRYHLRNKTANLLKKLKHWFNKLHRRGVMDYYLLDRKKDSRDSNDSNDSNDSYRKYYLQLKKNLNMAILERLLAAKGPKDSPRDKLHSEIEFFILTYINDSSSLEELENFRNFLKKKNYFDRSGRDFRVFYIERLIEFKSGQYDTVISKTEDLRESISFVKTGHMKDYQDVLLLLADAYISSRLLIRAMGVLKEVEKNDPGLTELYWRKMQIEQVIGPEDEDEANKEKIERKNRQYESILNSSRIVLAARSVKQIVYLINSKIIEIQLSEALKEKVKDYHLLRVFIDENLLYEGYLSKLHFPIKLAVPTEEKSSKHSLEIEIL